ncbi:SpaH/EbpB family LPXTG-anchored major pilin [Corynebacterium sp. CCUG 61414]|uniref:SpaH/EbpB family LPXTG-anchored major pilin n=1 Tax=Corynebacterium sp. CCUG 61414 TaxID=2823896 RepID=UPI00210E93D7|nr:SpaH/EbpB family LPXTG-anchored major pilin [Corynebacterium sp. CCUG 61414]MCQ4610407.1 SpaH/EbpB family LPXTG-anchored major pilin [Corynebacterium sp. CCUG 61414]
MAIALKKTAAIAIAAGLTFAGSAGIAAQDAMAQDGVEQNSAIGQGADPSTIDPNAARSLTIHKILNASKTGAPTGNEIKGDTPADEKYTGGENVAAVDFQVEELDYDITTNKGFFAAVEAAKNPATAKVKQDGLKEKVTTGADGSIKVPNVKVAAYRVTELESPEANVNGEPRLNLHKSDPFVVFVPMTNPKDTSKWNYNVHAYPKNTNTVVTKKLEDENVNVGDTVKYQIKGNIPGSTSDKDVQLNSFHVVDYYNKDELSNLRLSDTKPVQIEKADGSFVDVPANYYEVTPEEAWTFDDARKAHYNARKTVEFNEEGLKWLDANHRGAKVVTNWEAEFSAIGDNGDGEIRNTADVPSQTGESGSTRKPKDVPPPPGDTPEVVTFLAKLQLLKYADGKKDQPLKGAEFELYTRDLKTGKCNPINDDNKIKIGDVAKWTTNEKGQLTIDGLHITDKVDQQIANGQPADGGQIRDGYNPADVQNGYCLLETKAPEGYERIPQAFPIEFKLADRVTNEQKVASPLIHAEANNKPSTKVFLPSTGGMGILIVALAGLAIIGGGVYAARRNSRTA